MSWGNRVTGALTPACGCPSEDWTPPGGPVRVGGYEYLGGRYSCRNHPATIAVDGVDNEQLREELAIERHLHVTVTGKNIDLHGRVLELEAVLQQVVTSLERGDVQIAKQLAEAALGPNV